MTELDFRALSTMMQNGNQNMFMSSNSVSSVLPKFTSRSIESLFKEIRINNDIEHATFHMLSFANNLWAIPYVKTTYPAEWISYYLLNGLMKVDPVIRASRESQDPFFWSEIILTAAETSMMKRAREFGISVVGYSVPTYDIGPYRGLFSICPRPDDADGWEHKIRSRQSEIAALGFTMHVLARTEIDPYEGYAVNLSRREIECLQYIAAGKTHTDMADILEISEHTVRAYCRTARLKLNSSTLAQAVAKACAMGIL